ncbi:MAG: GAF domain-containing protein [Desulfomicrobium escambiense]|nr:GAF domain-containing protein [Desulfomicrobium escambiense]
MIGVNACHIYLSSEGLKNNQNLDEETLFLAGTSIDGISGDKYKDITYSLEENATPVNSFIMRSANFIKDLSISKNWKPKEILNEQEAKTLLAVPLANNSECIGVVCLENYTPKDIPQEHIQLIEITAKLFVTSMRLQNLVDEVKTLLDDENATPSELTHLRTELTASIGDLGDEQQMFVEALARRC